MQLDDRTKRELRLLDLRSTLRSSNAIEALRVLRSRNTRLTNTTSINDEGRDVGKRRTRRSSSLAHSVFQEPREVSDEQGSGYNHSVALPDDGGSPEGHRDHSAALGPQVGKYQQTLCVFIYGMVPHTPHTI